MVEVDDALETARRRLSDDLGTMLGTRKQSTQALGSVLARGASEIVARELAHLSAHMVTEPGAFYDAAFLVSGETRAVLRSALAAARAISDGPNALLLWSTRSRQSSSSLPELARLVAIIRRARFSRSEVTETVRVDLVAAASEAAAALQERLSSATAAELPSTADLSALVELVGESLIALNRFLALRADFETTDFRTSALLRVLEAAEAGLVPLVARATVEGSRDVEAETSALASVTALEAAVDALVQYQTPFGELLVLEGAASPRAANLVATLSLSPVPERARGGAVYHGQVVEHPSAADLRVVSLESPETWADSTQVEQRVQVAYDEHVWLLGVFVPLPPLIARGTGTAGGDPYYPDVLDAAPADEEIDAYASTADLPPAPAVEGRYAYVSTAGAVDLYHSDGTSWVLVQEEADHRRGRFLLAAGFPLGERTSVSDQIRVRSTDGAVDTTLTVIHAGPAVGTGGYEQAFGVLGDRYLSNTSRSVTWELQDRLALPGKTNRFRTQAGSWTPEIPAAELLNRQVTVWQPGHGWTHRFITEVYVADGPSLEVVLDVPVSDASAFLYMAKLPGLPYPRSPFIRVRPRDAEDVVDLRPGDVLVARVADVDETRVVLSCMGEVAALSAPLLTHPEFAAEARTYRRGEDAALLGEESPLVYVEARRFRGVEEGDRVVALPTLVSGVLPSGWVEPVYGEAYVVTGLRSFGIEVRAVTETQSALPRSYARMAVWGQEDTSTSLYRVGEGSGFLELERTARRQKAAEDPDAQLDDVWPLREVTLFMRGVPVDAQRAGEDLLRVSTPGAIFAASQDVEARVRAEEDSRRAGFRVVDNSVAEMRSGPYPRVPLSACTHSVLGTTQVVDIAAGALPATAAGVPEETTLTYVDPLVGSYRGPVARGGAREYGFFAWATWKAKALMESPPDLTELKEDLGRAYADLGRSRTRTYSAAVVDVVSVEGRQVRLQLGTTPANPALLHGVDVVTSAESYPPARVVRVLDASSFPDEVVVELTGLPALSAPYEVTLADTAIAQAWREMETVRAFLDAADGALDALVPPESRVVSLTAQRLDAAGYPDAADEVRAANFSKWIDPVTLSDTSPLAERLDALVSSLLSRRRAPLDG